MRASETSTRPRDRLTAAEIEGRPEAVVYFDGNPILFLIYCGRWRCDHVVLDKERPVWIHCDCLDEITFTVEHTLAAFLDKVWGALNAYDNALIG